MESKRWAADAGIPSQPTSLCSLADDEMSPAALAARGVVRDCVHELVATGQWAGVVAVEKS